MMINLPRRAMDTFRSGLLCSAATLGLVCAAEAHAQTAPGDGSSSEGVAAESATATESETSEIIVTGSRITRRQSPSPINSLDAADIADTGKADIAAVLNQQPQFGVAFGSGSQNYATAASGFGSGTELVNLRNLGAQRTLVLVNGRRHVGGDPGTSSVDLNAIPFAMVERVDTVSGAASAVYGADAVSGVVNIVTRSHFDGVQISGQAGTSDRGDGREYRLSGLLGGKFDDGRGSFVASVEYNKSDGVLAGDRAFGEFDANNFTISPNNGSRAVSGGLIFGANGNFSFTPSGTLLPTTQIPEVAQHFNRLPYRYLLNPTKRTIAAAAINYDIVPSSGDGFSASVYAEGSYSHVNSLIRFEPLLFVLDGARYGTSAQTPIDGPRVSASNPYLQAIAPIIGPIPSNGVTVFRRLSEYGPRTAEIDRDTFRIALGLKGNLGGGWRYDGYYQYGRVLADQVDTGVVDRYRFFAGLDVVPDGAGGYRCADSRYVALGCIPVNIFGYNSISQSFIKYSTIASQAISKSQQEVVSGYISGPLFSLPGGPLTMVLGGEYRREKAVVQPDQSYIDFSNSSRFLNGVEGDYDTREVFGELQFPLLADRPFFKELSLGIAGRYSDYSTIGGEISYSGNLQWKPVDAVQLRAVYSTAVRAPNIRELFAPTSRVIAQIADPCDTVSDAGGPISLTGARAAACAADLGPLLAGFNQTQAQRQTVGAETGGNRNLKAEDARTITIGAAIAPRDLVPGLSLTADYIDIRIKKVITGLALQTITDQCYDQPGRPAEFCGSIVRNASTGQLITVRNSLFNAASERVRALDVQLGYRFDLASVAASLSGEIALNANWSHLFEHTFRSQVTSNVDDRTGQVGDFRNRYAFGLTYSTDDLEFNWNTRILGRALADTTISSSSPLANANRIPSIAYHDVRFAYQIAKGRYRLFAGVQNLFDKQPPIITTPARTSPDGSPTVGGIYDQRGRFFYTGITANF